VIADKQTAHAATEPFRCYILSMTIDEALIALRQNESALRARGVAHAALFGSVARGDNRPDSDIDVLVEFDPEARITVFDYAGVKAYIASLFTQRVDVIDREALKPHLRSPSARDAVYAF
jgi:predicted nucleotidyltransferase